MFVNKSKETIVKTVKQEKRVKKKVLRLAFNNVLDFVLIMCSYLSRKQY